MAYFKRYYAVYVLTVAAILSATVLASRQVTRLQAVSAQQTAHAVLLIDPGHGGEDGGALGVDGLKESDLNLEIGLRLRDVSLLLGIDAQMTRSEDVSLYEAGCDSIAQKKSSDLRRRVQMANAQPGTLLVSIHQNSFPEAKYYGAQVFYAPTDGSKALAELLQTKLCTELDPRNRRVCKPSEGVFLLEHLQGTGILVECGFLTNPAEAARLQTPAYQKQLACAIAATLRIYSGAPDEV